jgi:hypothetical protein
MGSESELLWGVLFGSVGFGFFFYGKKQKMIVPLICGLALMVYPYFMPNAIVLILIGFLLVLIPYFFSPLSVGVKGMDGVLCFRSDERIVK